MDHAYNASAMQQMVASAAMSHRQDACYPNAPYRDGHAYMRDSFFFQPIHPVFTGGIESYLDPKYAADPAAFASRLPYFPFRTAYGVYEYGFEPAFIRKRNERERQRVKCVNDGYARLREHLPDEYAEKRLSKVETLRGAIHYIKELQKVLGVDHESKSTKKDSVKRSDEEASETEQDAFAGSDGLDDDEDRPASRSSTEQPESPSFSNAPEIDDVSESKVKAEPSNTKEQANSPQALAVRTACMYGGYEDSATGDEPRARTLRPEQGTNLDDFCAKEVHKQYSGSCLYKHSHVPTIQSDTFSPTGELHQSSGRNSSETCQSSWNYGVGRAPQRCSSYSEVETRDFRFHPYECQKDAALREHDFGLYHRQGSLQLKQENLQCDGYYQQNSQEFASFLQSRYRNLSNMDYYHHRSSLFESHFRSYGKGADSDGFKSDYSPGSSSIGTSP